MQVAKLVDDYGMVSFTPMDVSDEDRCEINENRLQSRMIVVFINSCSSLTSRQPSAGAALRLPSCKWTQRYSTVKIRK